MILVSITTKEDKCRFQLQHKMEYFVEKTFKKKKPNSISAIDVIISLIFYSMKLFFIEMRSKIGNIVTKF